MRQNSGTTTPRTRPPATTLNIPGMTRSRVSPDGRIAQRDVASKLVIIMVGLPARGKSYITKKIQRYLSWQQHNTEIFNVGHRRRVAAGVCSGAMGAAIEDLHAEGYATSSSQSEQGTSMQHMDAPTQAAHILLNGMEPNNYQDSTSNHHSSPSRHSLPVIEAMDQTAEFFDPTNARASQVREQVALSTLDELLDYLLLQGGSVGILDATNSTIERRKLLFKRIKEREPRLGILFIESICEDQDVSQERLIT
jgi:6-phosphofructo-2-kinase